MTALRGGKQMRQRVMAIASTILACGVYPAGDCATAEPAADRYYVLNNQSQYTVTDIIAMRPRGILQKSPDNMVNIPPGYHLTVNFGQDGPCLVAIKLVLSNGSQPKAANGFNICQFHNIYLGNDLLLSLFSHRLGN
jgi:hypothetical protein